jgi:dTMP kinase
MAQGKFITFEGGEGSGKSTQARLLSEALKRAGHDVVTTREPGGTPFAEEVRKLILGPRTPAHPALSEALLFYAARADHLEKVIRPALKQGKWIVCDRFSDSTRVYQGHAGALPLAAIESLESLVVAPTIPDLTLVVDIEPRLGLARAAVRQQPEQQPGEGPDAFEKRDLAFHEKLRKGFLKIAAAEPARCVVIDGAKPQAEVAAAIWAAIETRLLAGVT